MQQYYLEAYNNFVSMMDDYVQIIDTSKRFCTVEEYDHTEQEWLHNT